MKFEKLYNRAELLEFDKIVTGHYARVVFYEKSGKYLLKKAKNLDKDQSYVLYFLTQEQLARTLFPLGEFESKDEVRALAEKRGFVNAKKHDSQDICFVQNESYGDFIERYAGLKFPEGDFVDESGKVLGRHKVYDGSAKRSRSCPARPPLCQGKGHRAQQGRALPRKRALYKNRFCKQF